VADWLGFPEFTGGRIAKAASVVLGFSAMGVTEILRAATGWLELGLADEALYELQCLPAGAQTQRAALELKLAAQMERESWNSASETARLLCLKEENEPEYFLRAAFCLHETGDTLAACNQLLRGPKSLFEMAIFHYNLACYLWTLGEGPRARSHLKTAIAMDESFIEAARKDRDLSGIGEI
jgi:predicted Zn-dependent protease